MPPNIIELGDSSPDSLTESDTSPPHSPKQRDSRPEPRKPSTESDCDISVQPLSKRHEKHQTTPTGTLDGGRGGSESSSSDDSDPQGKRKSSLRAIEDRQRERILNTAREDHKKVEDAFARGLKELSDDELRVSLDLICKYGANAAGRFQPSILEYLRGKGTGKGYDELHKKAWEEGTRRGMQMKLYEKRPAPGERLEKGSEQGNPEVSSPVRVKPAGIRQVPAQRQPPKEGSAMPPVVGTLSARTSGKPLVTTATATTSTTTMASTSQGYYNHHNGGRIAPSPSSESSDHDIRPKGIETSNSNSIDNLASPLSNSNTSSMLPSDKRSRFWCSICRKGPAICVHRHRMIMNILEEVSSVSSLDLLFAGHLLGNWDHGGRGDLGIEPFYMRHFTEMELSSDRSGWALKIAELVEERLDTETNLGALLERLNYAIHQRNELLDLALARWKERVAKRGPAPLRLGEPESFERMRSGSRTSSRIESTSNGDDAPVPISAMQAAGPGHSVVSKKRKRSGIYGNMESMKMPMNSMDSAMDLDAAHEEQEKSDFESDSSDDSLIQGSKPSLNEAIDEASKERLFSVAKRLLERVSHGDIAKIIRGLCNEGNLARKFVVRALKEVEAPGSESKAMEVKPSFFKRPDVRDTSVSDASFRKPSAMVNPNPSTNSVKVECEACQTSFDPSSPRQAGECLHHPGDLVRAWRPHESVKHLYKKELGIQGGLIWKCCNNDGKSPGCAKGTHTATEVSVDVEGPPDMVLDRRDNSPLQSIELIQFKHGGSRAGLTTPMLSPVPRKDSFTSLGGGSTSTAQFKLNPQTTTAEEQYDFESVPDFSPDRSALANLRPDALTRHTKTTTANPKDLTNDPDSDKLDPRELQFAKTLRWSCSLYLLRKRQLFSQCLERHRDGTPFIASHFSKSVPGTHQKGVDLFVAFEKIGWLARHNFEKYLIEPAKEPPAVLGRAAANMDPQHPREDSGGSTPLPLPNQQTTATSSGSASRSGTPSNAASAQAIPPRSQKFGPYTLNSADIPQSKPSQTAASEPKSGPSFGTSKPYTTQKPAAHPSTPFRFYNPKSQASYTFNLVQPPEPKANLMLARGLEASVPEELGRDGAGGPRSGRNVVVEQDGLERGLAGVAGACAGSVQGQAGSAGEVFETGELL